MTTPPTSPATPATAASPTTGWIQTHSGGRFYPLAPRAAQVNLEDIAHALSNFCRFNGHCSHFYSVAEHSVRVADAVAAMTDAYGTRPAPDLVLLALLHDATEAYLCDLPRPLKHAGQFGRLYQEAEERVGQAILERFNMRPTVEDAAVVKHADAVLLATEARDLMPQREVAEWAWMPPPLPDVIYPMSPEDARDWFMERAGRLLDARSVPVAP